jgi:hypothetical protein
MSAGSFLQGEEASEEELAERNNGLQCSESVTGIFIVRPQDTVFSPPSAWTILNLPRRSLPWELLLPIPKTGPGDGTFQP